MTITLDIDSILDYVYADSAIGAVQNMRDPKTVVAVLTPDRRHGLRRVAAQAAGIVAAKAGSGISADIPAAGDDGPATITLSVPAGDRDSTELHLRNAIALMTLSLSAAASGDHRLASCAEIRASEALEAVGDKRPFTTKMSPI